MILDDPTSSLDNKVTASIMEGIREGEEMKGKTFIISTNNIKMFDYADKIVFMVDGRVDFFGTYEQMMAVRHLRRKVDELSKAKGILDQSAKEKPEEESQDLHAKLDASVSHKICKKSKFSEKVKN